MKKKLQITTHFADGTPSETRDMTAEEIASIPEPTDEVVPTSD